MDENRIMPDELFKQKAFQWASNKSPCCFLNSCDFLPQQHPAGFGYYDYLIALGSVDEIKIHKNSFEGLANFYQSQSVKNAKPWLFGYFTYDLKNEIENLSSENVDSIQFPALHFFVPQVVITVEENIPSVYIHPDCKEWSEEKILNEIKCTVPLNSSIEEFTGLHDHLIHKISKQQYIESVENIKKHIFLGDVYELNFCIEMFNDNIEIDIENTYLQITKNSPSPFSCYYSVDDKYLMSASMERFLAKQDRRIFSQPIKGTAPRSNEKSEDEKLKLNLQESIKEKAENTMIVDLVRNDLSRIAERGSVRVDEFCRIYSYSHVHQMISTVSCNMNENLNWIDAMKACFPMGSMTGAPKISAMKLIDKYESTKRGLYSGAVGYVDPFGNFDFNVVIRSLQYNAKAKYLSLMVGSAITAKSDPAYEYEECLIKANALQQILNAKTTSEA